MLIKQDRDNVNSPWLGIYNRQALPAVFDLNCEIICPKFSRLNNLFSHFGHWGLVLEF